MSKDNETLVVVDGLVKHVADLLIDQGIALQPTQPADSLGRELQGED